tara:strand:+ start:1775 stop:2092 length:318 start_codon:yes stop_codon:yes gene_type:complete
MIIHHQHKELDKTLEFNFSGRLDFTLYEKFSEIYHSYPKETVNHYILNMSDLNYLDSSALGMLLLLKDYAIKETRISIINCIPEVYKILEIANFDQLFSIKALPK